MTAKEAHEKALKIKTNNDKFEVDGLLKTDLTRGKDKSDHGIFEYYFIISEVKPDIVEKLRYHLIELGYKCDISSYYDDPHNYLLIKW
jgi:hypothetical protein